MRKILIWALVCSAFIYACPILTVDAKEAHLLNVSYDTTRELYKQINQAYINEFSGKVKINQSHGGSAKQARAVIEGLQADVVTLAVSHDIDMMASKGLLASNWRTRLPNQSSPYSSIIVFLVRKDKRSEINDWDDLINKDVKVITANPKTSGGARWNFLAACAYALKKFNNDHSQVAEFIRKLYSNVPVLDVSARSATMTFIKRNIGDVMVTWENEALYVLNNLAKGQYEIVVPSLTIKVDLPVAVVDKIAEKHGTLDLAESYLKFLYSDLAQNIIADNYYRPSSHAVFNAHNAMFPAANIISVDDLGGWQRIQEKYFNDGGLFDQIYSNR